MQHLLPYSTSALGGIIAATGGVMANITTITEDTMIPLGVYVGGILLCCSVFYTVGKMIWAAARLITNAINRLEHVERELAKHAIYIEDMQKRCNQCSVK